MNIVLMVGSKILNGTEEEENNSAYKCQDISTETDAFIGAPKIHKQGGHCWQRQVMHITAEAQK